MSSHGWVDTADIPQGIGCIEWQGKVYITARGHGESADVTIEIGRGITPFPREIERVCTTELCAKPIRGIAIQGERRY